MYEILKEQIKTFCRKLPNIANFPCLVIMSFFLLKKVLTHVKLKQSTISQIYEQGE